VIVKKVLFVLPSLKLGGAERYAVEFCNWLVEDKDFEVSFFIYDNQNHFKGYLNDEIKIFSANIELNSSSFIKRILNYYVIVPYRLAKILKKWDINVICSGYQYYCELQIILSFIFNFNLLHLNKISFIHSDLKKRKRNIGIFRKFLFLFSDFLRYKFFQKVIYVNENLVSSASFRKPSKELILSVLLDGQRIIHLSNDNSNCQINLSDEKEKYFLCASRFERIKNLELAIRAFNLIKNEIEDNLFLIGEITDKKYFDEIMILIEKLQLQHKVKYLGKFINPYPLIKNSKALIMTSLYEGWPRLLSEASILEVPVITVSFKNFPSLFNDYVWLTNDYDEKNIACFMKLSYQELKSKKTLKDYIMQNYDVSIIGPRIKEAL